MVQKVVCAKERDVDVVGVEGVDIDVVVAVRVEAERFAQVAVKLKLVVTDQSVVGHVVVRAHVGDGGVGSIDILDVAVGRQARQRPQSNGRHAVECIASLLVLESELERVVADVGRTCGRNTELALVKLAEAVALCAIVVPQAVGAWCFLAVEQCIVLNSEQVVIRPIEEGDIWGAVKQVEVLLRDRGQLWVEL